MSGRPDTAMDGSASGADAYRDAEYSVELNRWLLRPIGLWPAPSEASRAELILRRSVNAFCYGIIGFFVLSCSLYAFVDVQEFDARLPLFGPLNYGVLSAAKYFLLLAREEDIKRSIGHMETDWRRTRNLEDRKIMRENAVFGRRLVISCAGFMFGGVFIFQGIVPLAAGKTVVENVTFRQLSSPVSRLIVDTRYSPVNEIMIFVQCICGFVMNLVTVGAFSLTAICAMHACGQLQVVMSWIGWLVEGRLDRQGCVDARFADIVRQHVRTLSFVSLMDDMLCEVLFVEVVASTLNLCLLGYYIITDLDGGEPFMTLTYVLLLSSFVFNIFIFCYIGELLTEQCKKVGETSYMIEWHKLRGHKGRGLILLICMSHCSVHLSAGKFLSLSFDSFGTVVKASVAYLNVLRKITS